MPNAQLDGTVQFFLESRSVVFQALLEDAGTVAPGSGWVFLDGDMANPRPFQTTNVLLVPVAGATAAALIIQGEYADADGNFTASSSEGATTDGAVTAQLLTTITNYPPPPPPPQPPQPGKPPPPPPPPPKPPVTYTINETWTG